MSGVQPYNALQKKDKQIRMKDISDKAQRAMIERGAHLIKKLPTVCIITRGKNVGNKNQDQILQEI